MIVNMPVNNGVMATSVSNQSPSELCDILKRKYQDSDIISPAADNAQEASTPYSEETAGASAWKKRHIDATVYHTATSTYQPQTPATISSSSSHSQDYVTSDSNTASPSTITSASSTAALSNNAGSFNITANSSAFINDLFAYDANLLEPVGSEVTLGDSILSGSQPIFTTPSTVCINTTGQFEEENADNWQASDLLELDHRYNSTLQTEISQLTATVPLKAQEQDSMSAAANCSPHQNQQQPLYATTQKSAADLKSEHQINASDADADFEDKNLSWLLNFKFDEFPHLNPDVTGGSGGSGGLKTGKNHSNHSYGAMGSCSGGYKTMGGSPYGSSNSNDSQGHHHHNHQRCKSPRHSSNKAGKKFEELVMEVTSEIDGSEMSVAENVVVEDTTAQRALKKPPFTYTELIEYALEDKGELTVSGIYQWISDRFPYYKSNDDRWKNSVRHNLSINPHFRKGHKAPQGAGHLWTISSGDSAENVLAWEHKKQRLDLFFKMESINRERLAQHQQQMQQQTQQQHQQQNDSLEMSASQAVYDEAAIAAATLQQEMMQHQSTSEINISPHAEHSHVLHRTNANEGTTVSPNNMDSALQQRTPHQSIQPISYNDLLNEEELRKTAGQILNGIHRGVEVQPVNQTIISTYHDVLLDNEYLNPVQNDVAVNESGLQHNTSLSSTTLCSANAAAPYYVTEIDPMDLGIHMNSHPQPLAHTQQTSCHNHIPQQHPPLDTHSHNHHHYHHHNTNHTVTLNGDEADVVLFNDEFNLNYFSYNPATDIVA